jgi:hypothetical protein
MGDRNEGAAGRTAEDAVSRRGFLVLVGGAGIGAAAIGCDASLLSDGGGAQGTDPLDPGASISNEQAVSLRRLRYRRHLFDGSDINLESFDAELAGRYSADLFAHSHRSE